MKTLAAVAVAAVVSTGCVVPVAGPALYGEPSIYGRVEAGNYPPSYGNYPPAYGNYPPSYGYSQPIVVAPYPYGGRPAPIHLHVPPGHRENGSQHCSHYNACDRPGYSGREPHPRAGPPPMTSETPGRSWRDRGERSERSMPPSRPLSRDDPRVR